MKPAATLAALALALMVAPAEGQFGKVVVGPIDLSIAAGNPNALGVQSWVQAGYVEYHVSVSMPSNRVYVLDSSGGLLRQYNLPPSSTGWCDGATDGVHLMWGSDRGIYVADTAGLPASTIQTNNGLRSIGANPITCAPGLPCPGVYRALAYDPGGDGGNGSFWIADGSSDLYEINLDGTALLRRWPHNGSWSIHGLAFDSQLGVEMLWANSSPSQGDLVEIDPLTGTETGNRIVRVPRPTSDPGGLCLVVREDPYYCTTSMPFTPHKTLVAVNRGAPGEITGYRLHRDHLTSYSQEADLYGIAEATPSTTPVNSDGYYTFSDRWFLRWNFWDMRSGNANLGRPSVVVANVTVNGSCYGFFATLPEFERCLFGSAIPLFLPPNLIGQPDVMLQIPPGVFHQHDTIQCQGIYLDIPGPIIPCGGLWAPGLVATNTLTFAYQ